MHLGFGRGGIGILGLEAVSGHAGGKPCVLCLFNRTLLTQLGTLT